MYRLLLFTLLIGCVGCSGEDDPAIDCNTYGLRLSVSSVTTALCGNADGSFTASAEGGDGAYRFSLNNGDANTTGEFVGLRAGEYTLSVRDNSSCTVTASVTIENEDGVKFDSIQLTDAGCGSLDGTISVAAIEGTPPYAYAIGEGDFQNEAVFEGIGAGEYLVRLKDAQDCETSRVVRVMSGTSWSAQVQPIILNNCALPDCHGGSQPPDFRNFQNVVSMADRIKTLTGNGTMPPVNTLDAELVSLIACWVDDGAQDN